MCPQTTLRIQRIFDTPKATVGGGGGGGALEPPYHLANWSTSDSQVA